MNADILPVLDEITAVLKKHDMTGLIIVGNGTHVDWRLEIEATWSCARIEPDHGHPNAGAFVRIRSQRSKYPSAAAQKETLQATIGNFVSMSHALDILQENLTALLTMIGQKVDFLGKSTDE